MEKNEINSIIKEKLSNQKLVLLNILILRISLYIKINLKIVMKTNLSLKRIINSRYFIHFL
jgi:hypothetical protein